MSGLNKNMSEMTLEDRERRAMEFKNQGNAALASNNAPEAIRCYTEAIAWEPTNKIFWSNRSAANMMVGDTQAALEDGERCIDLVKHWAKGYSRKGAALQAMGKYAEAVEVFTKGLTMEPGNNMLLESLASAQAALKANPVSASADPANPPPAGADGEAEPSHMTDPVIGIDLGTTYSCVAVWDGDEGVKIIADEEGNRTTPSVVGFAAEGQRLVGKAAQRQAASNYANTVYDIKRVLGSRVSDAEVAKDIARFPFKVVAGDGDKPVVIVKPEDGEEERFHPEEVSAMVLTRMKTIAENFLGRPVGRAVITVPAYFNDAQRQATKDAGAIAGLEVMRIINEPTAAALAYGLDRTTDGDKEENDGPRLILVFDLGGGTFDVSVLSIDGGIFEVVATAGDTHLGGEDFDNNLVDFLKSEFERTNAGTDLTTSPRALKRLRAAAESAKRQLSSNLTTNVLIDSLFEGIDLSVTLTRAKFEKLNEVFFERCLDTVKHVLKDAKMSQDQIDDVVLVGGSTRIPRVQASLSKFFGGRDLCKSINPDEAVAYGAAVQGAVLGGLRVAATEQLLLVDVTALSLGIELEGKVFSAIIPRNSKVPVVKKKTYTTTEDFQEAVDVMIFEGERQCTDGNNLLGEFKITGIERAKRGVPQVEVAFSLDTNGILNVTARDMVTCSKAEVTLTNNKSRLSGDQIQKMLEDAERFKDADAKRVENVQARNELETFVYELRSRGRVDCAAACSDVAAWLEMGVPRTTKEYQTRLKELEGIAQGN